MIYSPTQLLPNNTSIDATVANTFYWDVDGQVSYQLEIYNNATNLSVYDSGTVTSANNYHTLAGGTLSNNNTYKFRVKANDATTSAYSNWTLFKTYATPTLTLSATPTTSQEYEFSFLYSQAQAVPVKSYEMTLYDASATPLSTSGTQYPSSLVQYSSTPLTYTFDGMDTGTTYGIGCVATTQYGVEVDSGITYFSITYTQPTTIPELNITTDDSTGSILLDWTKMKQITGVVSGSSSYVTGKHSYGLSLTSGSYLYYSEYIPSTNTVIYWVNLDASFDGDLVKFGEDSTGMRVFYENGKFGFELDNYRTVGAPLAVSLGTWIKLGISYARLVIETPTTTQILQIT